MSSMAAARSVLRSAVSRTALASRITAGSRAKPMSSPFRVPKHNNNRICRSSFRSTEEMSRCMGSLLPYHSATASALLTSMLSVSCRTSSWTPEGI
ncbi:hypothetical protein TIFTF001_007654 [Ficus carica]|uniref:Protein NUCLEAR FUSION DEFECTIVE 6, chloroplastic/mitochondrial-like n=1 Tax=Ficus carica TaxID=3494 RepID=A0AA87ZQQ9_FICCA|nr:hypothetical protein TIFTF001_007654 [Ficus carica]